MIKGIYGINIAVERLDEATKKYEEIFSVKSTPLGATDFAFPGLIGVKLDVGGVIINLISYTDENSSVAKFIRNRGEGLFLLSIEVDDVASSVEQLKDKGLEFVLKEPMRGDFGEVNFVHPRSAHGVQLEIYRPERG